jgi:Replication-relaxation
MATRKTPKRRPHFKRHNPPVIQITEDDITMLRHLAKHRFLRTSDISRLLERPYKKIQERLSALFHNRYVDRPRQQLEFYSPNEAGNYVHALGNAGARLIAELDDTEAAKVDWTDKNRDATRPFIKHTLLIADVMVGLELATRNHPTIDLIEPRLILSRAPEDTQRMINPWKWRAQVPFLNNKHDVALVPDCVFGLDFTDVRQRAYFFLEADRGTMPIARENLFQSSMQKKFLAYYYGHRAKHHTELYGIKNFRVLTVTTSIERTENMIANIKHITGGRGSDLFLFTHATPVRGTSNILTLDLKTGKGEELSLID